MLDIYFVVCEWTIGFYGTDVWPMWWLILIEVDVFSSRIKLYLVIVLGCVSSFSKFKCVSRFKYKLSLIGISSV